MRPRILSHRGLDGAEPELESSRSALAKRIARGFGLELDVQVTSDDEVVISHDPVQESAEVFLEATPAAATLRDVVAFASGAVANGVDPPFVAIHVKHPQQDARRLALVLDGLRALDRTRFMLFDLAPAAAELVRSWDAGVQIGASVVHRLDCVRFNGIVGGTLRTVEECIAEKRLYDWAWLDEWDRSADGGGEKALYTRSVFAALRGAGLRVAVVSPELHATHPPRRANAANVD